jgi:biopolymer transport protein ExbB/TolQ
MLLFWIEVAYGSTDGASGFTLMEMWQHAGFIAKSVIIMLAIMLIGCIFVAVERLIYFNKARKQSMELAARVVVPLQDRKWQPALELVKDEEFKESYLAAMLKAGLTELDERFDETGIRLASRAIEKSTNEEISKLRSGMAILATTGSTAPFVGLFGTTFGVINAFQGMATAGSGLASISAGISEALITTGVGIGVAVLGVWFYNYFNERLDKVAEELSSAESDLLDWADKRILDPQAGK